MAGKFGAIVFAPLDGEPPPELGLEPLPPADRVRTLVERAFGPFCLAEVATETLGSGQPPRPPTENLILVYVYGHAWLQQGGAVVAPPGGGVETAETLIDRLVSAGAADRTVLILDCCHAGAFDQVWGEAHPAPRLVVYGSGADESAIALQGEKATRLSLALGEALGGRKPEVDLVQTVVAVRERLSRDDVIRGQSVDYRMNGPAVGLVRGAGGVRAQRERAVALVRNLLLGAGAVLASLLILGGWFYWSHDLVEIDLGLPGTAKGVQVQAFADDIHTNGHKLLQTRSVTGRRIRFWILAGDTILRVLAQYPDGAPRGLAFHLDLHPSFALSAKSLHLAVPPAADILEHPNMAYVPAVSWRRGQELALRQSKAPFWIDIAPPTTEAYLPIAEALYRAGKLKAEDSFLLTAIPRSAAIDAVDLGQIRSLNDNLGDIFGVIDQSQSQHVSAPSDIVVGAGKKPCDHCPAVMTRYEAGLYCSSHGKRLPTDEEWELAVRGVDGRVYPWGDKFDPRRANVPGLPQKGDPPPALKPVDAYKDELSPYGLIDTVGNAGDWVESDGYERSYMGATYRYNPEDATVFRELPVTDEDYLVREITARCATDGHPAKAH